MYSYAKIGSRRQIVRFAAFFLLSICGMSGGSASPSSAQMPDSFRDCRECPEMIAIPAGEFMMGSSQAETDRDIDSSGSLFALMLRDWMNAEHPQHKVAINVPFALGRYPITRGEFATFVNETGYSASTICIIANNRYRRGQGDWRSPGIPQTDRDPVVCVGWDDVQAYLGWLNGKVRRQSSENVKDLYRLPSEAEWEYAARAGTQSARWWGDAIGRKHTNCAQCGSEWGGKRTAPVDSFPANPFGLYDMLGNASQRVSDCWHESYEGAPTNGDSWTTGDCGRHVVRGGDWDGEAWHSRSAMRFGVGPTPANNISFRVAKSVE